MTIIVKIKEPVVVKMSLLLVLFSLKTILNLEVIWYTQKNHQDAG